MQGCSLISSQGGFLVICPQWALWIQVGFMQQQYVASGAYGNLRVPSASVQAWVVVNVDVTLAVDVMEAV